MTIYSINDVEKLCGIKAHTLRIWEKRYGIISPRRTETNIRYYLDEDLQRILNISMLNKNGYKISKIAKMSEEDIKIKVGELSQVSLNKDDHLDALMFSMLELNEYKFNKILDHKIDSDGFLVTMQDYLNPFMEKLSAMWIAGTIKGVHEDFVSNIIRQKTIVAIDNNCRKFNKNSIKFLLFLPEQESHELSLLYLHFLLKENGINVINLGNGVPMIDVIEGQKILKADYIFTMFNENETDYALQPYINELSRHLINAELLISGYQTVAQNINIPDNVRILSSIDETVEIAFSKMKEAPKTEKATAIKK